MDETGWRRVARDSDLAEKAMVVVALGEEKILLVRLEGTVRAVGHECPHYQEKLENGALFGTQIVCKSHFARMDVTTGKVIAPPAFNDLPVYPVKVENGEVWVGPVIKPKFPKPAAAPGSDARVFLIAGAGAAGNTAVETLRRQGFAGRLVMITGESERPYDRPNLSKDFITGKAGEEWLPLRGPKFYAAQGIELLTGRKIVSLDTQKKVAVLEGGETIGFDKALLATGGNPRRLPIPGADGEGCYMLRTTVDARAIVAAASRWKSVVLIGAGFIGLELAGSLRDRGLEITLVAPESVPLAHILGDRIGAYVKSLHESREVRLLLGRTPARIEGAAGAKTVVLADGARLSAGFVVIALGILPAVEYLSGTGLVENGAVPVDERMRTQAPHIFAAGDIAALPDADGERQRVEHWVAAQRQGQRAALGMLGRDPGPMEIDFFWSRQAGASLKYAGHAREFDQTVYRGIVEEGKFLAGYFRKGVLKAAATIGMALDLVAVERLMRLGAAPSAAQLGDEGFDLMAAAHAAGGD
ncbi:MAG: FAD-dependent oxidoreductase [Spirochaetia bacterium]|jgi:NADPH-dependent 2,4-dienoyl-CoA reductase/sulfur reductase-like enzyme/nitrite reductase/ring-hydroxylating ferredoxin subunit